MAGITLTYQLDAKAAEGALAGIIAAGEDLSPLLDEVGSFLVLRHQERFDQGIAPDGAPWKPTIRGGQILVLSGRLRASIHHQVEGNDVLVGTNVVYAAIHQGGGVIKPKDGGSLVFRIGDRLVFVGKVNIPARPFVGIGMDDEAEIVAIVADYLKDAAQGGTVQ